jgi:multisubunit Na+/H+ antiporter MnhG subunit
MTMLAPILQQLGVMTTFLAVWIFMCDHENEFLPVLFVAGLLMLGVGLAME